MLLHVPVLLQAVGLRLRLDAFVVPLAAIIRGDLRAALLGLRDRSSLEAADHVLLRAQLLLVVNVGTPLIEGEQAPGEPLLRQLIPAT